MASLRTFRERYLIRGLRVDLRVRASVEDIRSASAVRGFFSSPDTMAHYVNVGQLGENGVPQVVDDQSFEKV